MTGEALFVFLLLLSTIILFVSDRLRLDVVAMLVILALLLSGLLSAKEALAGFGDPVVVLIAGLFLLTSIFSQFISNTATTVLIAPIAMIAATKMGIAPYPLLMTVAIAASTAFSTPVASPVNTLVLGPGGYKFIDFVKLGVPLQLLVMALTLLVVPVLFPLK